MLSMTLLSFRVVNPAGHCRSAPLCIWAGVSFLLTALLVLDPSEAHGQTQVSTASRGVTRGTVFGGGIGNGNVVLPHFGGGIEFGIRPRLWLGGQASIAIDREDRVASLLVSARGQYAFANPSTAGFVWVPFVTAGVTRTVDLDTGFNVGTGVEWGRAPFALRLEALAHVFEEAGRLVEFRVGLVFGR
jgi:hypothetical protein